MATAFPTGTDSLSDKGKEQHFAIVDSGDRSTICV